MCHRYELKRLSFPVWGIVESDFIGGYIGYNRERDFNFQPFKARLVDVSIHVDFVGNIQIFSLEKARRAEGGPYDFHGAFSKGLDRPARFGRLSRRGSLRESDPFPKDSGRSRSRCIKRRITRCPFQDVQGIGVCGESFFSLFLPLPPCSPLLALLLSFPAAPAGVYGAR